MVQKFDKILLIKKLNALYIGRDNFNTSNENNLNLKGIDQDTRDK